MKSENYLKIDGSVTKTGLELRFNGMAYGIDYPESLWSPLPGEIKKLLLDNLTFASTMHLPMIFRSAKGVIYNTGRPFLEPYFRQNFIGDIPSCCDMENRDVGEEVERFLNLDFHFNDDEIKTPRYEDHEAFDSAPKAIIPLSFGKDSLLTFALSEEIGIEPIPVFVHEPGFSRERQYKESLGEKFLNEFGIELKILEHSLGLLRDNDHLGVENNEYGWGLQSTEYALMMLPYAEACRASYIFFGNEQSAGTSYKDSSGRWTVYPCYDQTPFWTTHINAMTSTLTGKHPVSTGSLIESLMDMMIQMILIRRYPRYAKYQMSCFAENEGGETGRWCHGCSICAKMYLLCLGSGSDPASIGFKKSMLGLEQRHFFSIFGGHTEFPYSRTELARNEQLFAFFCASRFGSGDPLVEEFRNSPLFEEAENKEKELLDIFTAISRPITTPGSAIDKLRKIFKEEIGGFLRRYEEV